MGIATDGFGTAYKTGEGAGGGGGGGGSTSSLQNTSDVPGTSASNALDALQLAGLDAGIIRTPLLASTVATSGGKPHTLVTGNGYLYLVCFGLGGVPSKPPRLEIYDIHTNPAVPSLVSSTDTIPIGLVYDLRLLGTTIWTVSTLSGAGRLQAWDVSDPAAPILQGFVATSGDQAFDLDLEETRSLAVLAFTGTHGMQIYDVLDPTTPVLRGSVSGAFASAAIHGNYAYASDFGLGFLRVYDVTTPTAPVLVGSLALGTDVRQLSTDGSYVYLARRTTGTISIIDVRVPSAPTLTSTFPMPLSGDELNPIYVSGDMLILGSSDTNPGAVYIWDVSDKTTPVLMRKITGGQTLFDCDLIRQYLYASNRIGNQELLTFQVRDQTVGPQPARRPMLKSVTAAYTIQPQDDTISADATSAPITVTLPNAAQVPGAKFTLTRINGGGNAVTLATTLAQTISGAASIVLSAQWSSKTVQSTGSSWLLIASL